MKYLWQFTHDDLDGAACAVIAAHIYPDHERTVKYCDYHGPRGISTLVTEFLANLKPQPEEEHILLITDILPSEEVCERINQQVGVFTRVVAYDHHETTSWARGKYSWVFHGDTCGARLFYESTMAISEKLHHFVYAVDAWDRWLLQSRYRQRGETLNLICKELGSVEFVKELKDDVSADSTGWLYQLGIHCRRKRDLGIRFGLQNLDRDGYRFTDAAGRKAVVLLGTANIGEFGDAILKARQDIDYVMFVLPSIDAVSLRSRKDGPVNVAQMAKSIPGGGGHQSAAGFPMSIRNNLCQLAAMAFMPPPAPTPAEK